MQLTRAVAGWEPREERVPLHAWLHPWLEALGPGLEDLYPGIRFKLAAALQAWHPSDALRARAALALAHGACRWGSLGQSAFGYMSHAWPGCRAPNWFHRRTATVMVHPF